MFAALSFNSPGVVPARIADSRRAPLSARPRTRISASHTSAAERPPPNRATTAASAPASLYDLLGIQARASTPEIKAAYRRLARACHPDVAKGANADEFIRVHAAYATLSDPVKRADYDRQLGVLGRLRREPRPKGWGYSSTFYGYTSRSWETDQCW